jgi:hypothetical protein
VSGSNVYLIHIEPAYKHAAHYIGYTTRNDVDERIEEHRTGRGAVLCRAAVNAGSELKLARVWLGVPRKYENRLKGRSARPLCPICNPQTKRRPAPCAVTIDGGVR